MATHVVLRQIQGDRLYIPDELIDASRWPEENVQALISIGDLRAITIAEMEADSGVEPKKGRGRPKGGDKS